MCDGHLDLTETLVNGTINCNRLPEEYFGVEAGLVSVSVYYD